MSVMLPDPPRVASDLGRLRVLGRELGHVLGDHARTTGRRRPTRPSSRPGRRAGAARPARAGCAARARRRAGPSRGASSPAPRSRRTSSAHGRRDQDHEQRDRQDAAPTSARRRTAGTARPSRSATATTATTARWPVSPMARSRNAAPSTAKAIPLAGRAYSVSCAATAATPAKTRPVRPQSAAERDRPGRREADGDEPERGDRGQHQVDGQHVQQRGGQPACRPTTAALEQLGPAGLLLGAGVPDHQQEAHQADEERPRG